MAEEQKNSSQKGMGELFIDLGTKGFPTLMKQLNSVAATFLLGKNSAQQFADTLMQPIKVAGKGAVSIGKMSAALGISLKEYMKLHLYLKSHNLSDGLLDDLANTADMLTKVHMGIGGISGEFAYAMHSMGLDWQNYDGSIESMIQLSKDVQKATQGMNEQQKKVLMQMVGLKNPEWKYAFERGDFNLEDYKTISDKQVEALIKEQEAAAKLAAEMEQLQMKLMTYIAPPLEKIANFLSDKVGKVVAGEYDEAIKTGGKVVAGGGALTAAPLIATPFGLAAAGAALINPMMNLGKKARKKWDNWHGKPTGGAAAIPDSIANFAPPFMEQNASIPSGVSNSNTTITINNENNVSVNNAQDAGRAVSSINQQTLTNTDYNQYQAFNQAGL